MPQVANDYVGKVTVKFDDESDPCELNVDVEYGVMYVKNFRNSGQEMSFCYVREHDKYMHLETAPCDSINAFRCLGIFND